MSGREKTRCSDGGGDGGVATEVLGRISCLGEGSTCTAGERLDTDGDGSRGLCALPFTQQYLSLVPTYNKNSSQATVHK